jgi:hypothetical protein
MLRVGEAFEEAVGGAKRGEGHLRAVDERRETFVMTLAGFAEEHSLNRTAGTQRFFDETNAFHADEAALGGQAATERQAELLEPAILAAGKKRGVIRNSWIASGFARRSHSLEVSKF